MVDDLLGFAFGGVQQEASGDAAIVFDGLEQFLFVLFTHARQFANLAFARQFLHAFDIAYLIGAPDQGDGLRPQALNLEQVQHRRAIFLQQFGVQRESALFEHFLQVHQHAFADAGDFEHFLGFVESGRRSAAVSFDGLRGVAVRADAEGILAVDFQQVGGFVENAGDGFVVHCDKD